jgi:hypothetical protein
VALGPTNTLFPILTYLDKCARSCITQLSPIVILFVPIKIAPYQTDELNPILTLPIIVALGAIKSAG